MKLYNILNESVTFFANGEHTNDSPDLNVANTNARLILRMLGIEEVDELHGQISVEQLPRLRQKLIRLKNSNVAQYSRAPSVEKSKNTTIGNVTSIGAPRIIDQGTDTDQISYYIDKLIEIVVYAQTNNLPICYG